MATSDHRHSERYRLKAPSPLLGDPSFTPAHLRAEERSAQRTATIAVMVTIAAIIAADGLPALLAIMLLLYAMQASCRRTIRLGPPLALLLSLTVLSLAEPNGRVLLSFGRLAFTETALHNALSKALRLIALLSASQALVGTNVRLKGGGRLDPHPHPRILCPPDPRLQKHLRLHREANRPGPPLHRRSG